MLRAFSRLRRHKVPVQEFLHTEASSGVLLLFAALAAIIIANSPLASLYERFLATDVIAGVGSIVIDKPLLLWINDGLMAVFFLLVGLEIKREIKYGQLSTLRSAVLPIACAIAGAVVPALIYLAFNPASPASRGWPIPMATDIAFAIGVLALLGSRVPSWAKVLLLAIAIVDDLIAVVIIALLFTEGLELAPLAVAAVCVVLLTLLNMVNARPLWPYLSVGLVLWVAVLKSGIHATVAGVVLGFMVPAIAKRQRALTRSETELLEGIGPVVTESTKEGKERRQQRLENLEDLVVAKSSPLHRLEHKLHPFVAFLIMPLFAFANAGVAIDLTTLLDSILAPISLGISVGLFAGKQLGMFAVAFAAIRLGLTPLRPDRETMTWIYGLSLLAGIGFTMSLFIGGLAFDDPLRYEQAKIGILVGSLLAGAIGYTLLRFRTPDSPSDE